jgi:hypothetical protein
MDAVFLENVRIFEPSIGVFSKPVDILIRGDRIEATGDLEPPQGLFERHDAGGRYALAGLWDSHVHLSFLTLQKKDAQSAALQGFVVNGITSVRDVGGPLEVISGMSRQIESGELLGPRVFFCGPLLSQPPLYELQRQTNRTLPGTNVRVESAEAVEPILDRLVEQGATMTKAICRWEPDVFHHYLDAAKARSLRVVLDPGPPVLHEVTVDHALALGVKSIEHAMAPWAVVLRDDLKRECDAFMATGQSCEVANELRFRIMQMGAASVSQEKLASLAETWVDSGAYLCPTLLVIDDWLKNAPPIPNPKPPGLTLKQWRRSLRGLHEVSLMLTRELSARGARILVGHDGTNSEGALKEMELLSRADVGAVEILRGATIHPATWLGVDDRFGSIAPGKTADILVLERDPLDRMDNIRSTWMVLRGGKLITLEEE